MARLTAFVLTALVACCAAQLESYRRQPQRFDSQSVQRKEFSQSSFNNQPGLVKQSVFNKQSNTAGLEQQSGKPLFNKGAFAHSVFNKAEFKKPEFNQPEVNQPAFNKAELNKPVFNQAEVGQSAFNKAEYKKPAFEQSGVSTFSLNEDKPVFSQSEVKQSVFSKPEYKKPEFNKNSFAQSSFEQSSSVVKTEFVPILKYANDVMPDGTFQYGYESGDGTAEEVRGYMRTLDLPESQPAQVIEGQYSYVGPEGERYTVTYIADENGFRAKGAHLPVPPPIPVEIQRSLELIKRLQAEQQPDVPVQQSELFAGVRRPVALDQIRGRALEDAAEDQSEVTTVTPDI